MSFIFPTEPSKIVIAGDWHANLNYSTRAVKYAAKNNAQVVLHLGDFGYTFEDSFVNSLNRELLRNNMNLLFVDGNHDNHEYLINLPTNEDGLKVVASRIAYLPRGFSWNWHDKKWLALGGAASVDRASRIPGVSWWSKETISYADVNKALEVGKVDYMLTHDVPAGANLGESMDKKSAAAGWTIEDLITSQQNREMLQIVCDTAQPEKMWCGHYHIKLTTSMHYSNGNETIVQVLDCDMKHFSWNMDFVTLN